jgi:hypothetical protein
MTFPKCSAPVCSCIATPQDSLLVAQRHLSGHQQQEMPCWSGHRVVSWPSCDCSHGCPPVGHTAPSQTQYCEGTPVIFYLFFVPSAAKILRPLTDLHSKPGPATAQEWSEEMSAAFLASKAAPARQSAWLTFQLLPSCP